MTVLDHAMGVVNEDAFVTALVDLTNFTLRRAIPVADKPLNEVRAAARAQFRQVPADDPVRIARAKQAATGRSGGR